MTFDKTFDILLPVAKKDPFFSALYSRQIFLLKALSQKAKEFVFFVINLKIHLLVKYYMVYLRQKF